jgi:hypothetical protein
MSSKRVARARSPSRGPKRENKDEISGITCYICGDILHSPQIQKSCSCVNSDYCNVCTKELAFREWKARDFEPSCTFILSCSVCKTTFCRVEIRPAIGHDSGCISDDANGEIWNTYFRWISALWPNKKSSICNCGWKPPSLGSGDGETKTKNSTTDQLQELTQFSRSYKEAEEASRWNIIGLLASQLSTEFHDSLIQKEIRSSNLYLEVSRSTSMELEQSSRMSHVAILGCCTAADVASCYLASSTLPWTNWMLLMIAVLGFCIPIGFVVLMQSCVMQPANSWQRETVEEILRKEKWKNLLYFPCSLCIRSALSLLFFGAVQKFLFPYAEVVVEEGVAVGWNMPWFCIFTLFCFTRFLIAHLIRRNIVAALDAHISIVYANYETRNNMCAIHELQQVATKYMHMTSFLVCLSMVTLYFATFEKICHGRNFYAHFTLYEKFFTSLRRYESRSLPFLSHCRIKLDKL